MQQCKVAYKQGAEDSAPVQDVTLQITAKLYGPCLVRKGKQDAICPGKYIVKGPAEGSPRRAGGQVFHTVWMLLWLWSIQDPCTQKMLQSCRPTSQLDTVPA